MKSLLTFAKKELAEQYRCSRLMILGLIFFALGIMNPAVAKLTPWLLEIFADSLAESGMIITGVEVSALDSWVQFYKNVPMGLIAFVLIEGGIFTKEYESGTLVLSLTKGLSRPYVVFAKSGVLILVFSACYWMCYAITYAYNAYFWDNSVARELGFSALCFYAFAIFIIALITLFSVISNTATGVFLGTGGVVFTLYLASIIPKVGKYLPTLLADGVSLISGVQPADYYTYALIITAAVSVLCFAMSIIIFNKKQL